MSSISASVSSVGRKGGMDHDPRRRKTLNTLAVRSVRSSSNAGTFPLYDFARRRFREHLPAVVAGSGTVARRAGGPLPALPRSTAGESCAWAEAGTRRTRPATPAAIAKRCAVIVVAPPCSYRFAAGETPARPGERMPFGSMASFSVSLKRRSAWLLKEYWSATSSWSIGGAR